MAVTRVGPGRRPPSAPTVAAPTGGLPIIWLVSKHLPDRLKDKVVVITGAGSGFGKLIAQKCAAGGARIVGVDIDSANLTAVFDGLRDSGFTVTSQVADVYDQMIKQGRGQVVNISSIYGNAGVEGSGVYSSTKAAVTVLSDSLRTEAKGKIKVTTVKPTGAFGTNLASGVVNETAIMGLVGQRGDITVRASGEDYIY